MFVPVQKPAGVKSFQESERESIIKALEHTGYRVRGKGGAAELLGLKPTTLEAKMRKLKIYRSQAG